MTSNCYRRDRGFTLVEMLTVVAIIALLISILVPSLSRARIQAKKVKTATLIAGIGNNLEMFHNEVGSYPDSKARKDPVRNWTNDNPDDVVLSGAHWLLRALVGHDFQGVDRPGAVMQDGENVVLDFQAPPDSPKGISPSRFPVFLDDAKVYSRDSDFNRFKTGMGDFQATGRSVIFDDFNGPILYYKAKVRAATAFAPDPSQVGVPGTYDLRDNAAITGSEETKEVGWDFAASGQTGAKVVHPFGQFIGDPNDIEAPPYLHTSDNTPDTKAKTFTKYLHDHAAHEAGGVIKSVKPDTFLLISPGPDGLYGTDDDVNNFSRAM
jgi:prepilin-type N-terminal cleavage/methylation domain-containing protein